jgi:tetratricopeptide (TPR) repeat protein
LASAALGVVVLGSQFLEESAGIIEGSPAFRSLVLSIDRLFPSPAGPLVSFTQGRPPGSDHLTEALQHQLSGRVPEAIRAYRQGLEELRSRWKREQASARSQASPPMPYTLVRIAEGSNNLAWLLATGPDITLRDPVAAVELAEEAVKLVPQEGNYWNTLGAARFRVRDWDGARAAFEKSMALRGGGDGFDWFFLAMIEAKLGQKEQARKWFDDAVTWTSKSRPGDVELKRFRAEAAAALGLPNLFESETGKSPAQSGSEEKEGIAVRRPT